MNDLQVGAVHGEVEQQSGGVVRGDAVRLRSQEGGSPPAVAFLWSEPPRADVGASAHVSERAFPQRRADLPACDAGPLCVGPDEMATLGRQQFLDRAHTQLLCRRDETAFLYPRGCG